MSRAHRLAWAAGFFDGEGYVTIGRRNHKNKDTGVRYTGYYLRIGINHVAPEPLYEFQKLFGGRIEYNDNVRGNRKPRHRWIANTSAATDILLQLMPYFKNKTRAAEIGIEFQSTMKDDYRGRGGVPEDIKLFRELLKEELVTLNAKD